MGFVDKAMNDAKDGFKDLKFKPGQLGRIKKEATLNVKNMLK